MNFKYLTLGLILLTSCSEKTSENAVECYRLWIGVEPTPEVNVIHGKYQESKRWYREFKKDYEVYLEMKVSPKWRNTFIKENDIIPLEEDWKTPSETPDWFIPPDNYKKWKISDKFQQKARIFEDSASGHIFIYEVDI